MFREGKPLLFTVTNHFKVAIIVRRKVNNSYCSILSMLFALLPHVHVQGVIIAIGLYVVVVVVVVVSMKIACLGNLGA